MSPTPVDAFEERCIWPGCERKPWGRTLEDLHRLLTMQGWFMLPDGERVCPDHIKLAKVIAKIVREGSL